MDGCAGTARSRRVLRWSGSRSAAGRSGRGQARPLLPEGAEPGAPAEQVSFLFTEYKYRAGVMAGTSPPAFLTPGLLRTVHVHRYARSTATPFPAAACPCTALCSGPSPL